MAEWKDKLTPDEMITDSKALEEPLPEGFDAGDAMLRATITAAAAQICNRMDLILAELQKP